MTKSKVIKQGQELVARCETAMVGTIDADGFPNVRAMLKMEHDGLSEIWFSTNASSRKIGQAEKNPKTCVYFADFEDYAGLMLVGKVEILKDAASKKRLWREGFEKYYPKGVSDPDYCVLRFRAQRGEYYQSLTVTPFEL